MGRDEFIALAARRLAEVEPGRGHVLLVAGEAGARGHVLLVAGEAGIGKGRLIGVLEWRHR